ncbi:unnamed protein product [Rotaria magnacalcarata]|uniref:Uncharacterized protein n=1 Tax=Rotaria magnacalcarata TaxID=392030 RepID=A0A819HL75_9BILA|nr:unnamed protein product [Rotaria magnacalcarata]CAF3914359.1 unnamed protein product [Rotaria magnacalcarata]
MSDNNRRSKIWITGPGNQRNLALYAHRHNYSLIREDNITLNLALKEYTKTSRRVLILPLCAFNSYMIANYLTTRYEHGDFAVHFAGAAWDLETHIFSKYGWDLFNHFADLASTDGVTLKKWFGWKI